MDWLSENWEWIAAVVAYALERYTALKGRKKDKLQQSQESSSPSVGTVTGKKTKKERAVSILFDVLPFISRIKRKEK